MEPSPTIDPADREPDVVPDRVTDDAAVFTEPLAAAFHILAQSRIDPGDRVVVFGDGKLGQLIAQAPATTACAPSSSAATREAGAVAARGIATQVEPPPARSADVVVDARAAAKDYRLALRAAPAWHAGPEDHVRRRHLADPVGDRRRRNHDCRVALRAVRAGAGGVASGAVDVSSLIEARLPLADAVDAVARAGSPGTLKVLLVP